jgi:EmrB/QacA subfamily drug resistance transporter
MVVSLKPPCDEGIIRSAPNTAPATRDVGRWVLATTILGSSLNFINGTVVNVALPVIQTDLHATVADVQWVVEAYTLLLASLMLVGGSMGDRLGRLRIFASGVALFAVASVWCGLAPNISQLVIARAVQGVGGALLVPGSLALISATFSDQQRGRAIGTWSAFTAITTAVGPLIGGWLVDHASWRWVFFINVPLALIVLALAFWRVPESRNRDVTGGLDWFGALLVTTGLGALVYGLIEAGTRGFTHPVIVGALVLGTLGLAAFLAVEAHSSAPMLPLSLFRSRTFSGANLLTLFLYAALGGTLFFLPFNLIQVQGYGATATGAAFLPFSLIMFLLSSWSGGLVTRYGAKLPLAIGPVIAAVGLLLFIVPGVGGSYWTTFFPAIVVLGLGMAISVAPLTTAVMGAVARDNAGLASGVNNAVAQLAPLLAIAVLGIVVTQVFTRSLDNRLAELAIPPGVQHVLEAQGNRLAAIEIPGTVSDPMRGELRQAVDASFVRGYRLVMLIAAGLALASALTAWLLIKGKQPGGIDLITSSTGHNAGRDPPN